MTDDNPQDLPYKQKFIVFKRRFGAPRWMVTFADLMALLLALFVLLLTFAEFDVERFVKSAAPIRSAFKAATGITPEAQHVDRDDLVVDSREAKRERWRNDTYDRLQILLASEINQGLVTLNQHDNEIALTFPAETTFASGGAALSPLVEAVLNKVGDALFEVKGPVEVRGHTDDIPINTAEFRSNWDLSAERAVSVVHYLLEHSRLKPERISAQGLADSRPLVPNDSDANRAANRRLEIAVQIPDFSAERTRWQDNFGR